MKYSNINKNRLNEIANLLRKNPDSYKDFSTEEKKCAHVILLVISIHDFNPDLLPDEVLNDIDYLYWTIQIDSSLYDKFKVKIEDEYFAKIIINKSVFQAKHLSTISDELMGDPNFVSYIIRNKPYFFANLTQEMKEKKEVSNAYIGSAFVNWNEITNVHKTPKTARYIIEKTFNDLSAIINDLPSLKNQKNTLLSIIKFFNGEDKKFKNKYVKMFHDAFSLDEKKFAILINTLLEENINVNYQFIKLLDNSKYKILCENINIPSLKEDLNYRDLLKTKVIEFLLISKLEKIDKEEIIRVRPKI